MCCNLGTVTNRPAYWYKQVPGGATQFVLRLYQGEHSPDIYGTGFSSNRFTSTRQSETESQFIIKNVEAGDTAVYYCNTWDSFVSEIRITVIHTMTKTSVLHFCIRPALSSERRRSAFSQAEPGSLFH